MEDGEVYRMHQHKERDHIVALSAVFDTAAAFGLSFGPRSLRSDPKLTADLNFEGFAGSPWYDELCPTARGTDVC